MKLISIDGAIITPQLRQIWKWSLGSAASYRFFLPSVSAVSRRNNWMKLRLIWPTHESQLNMVIKKVVRFYILQSLESECFQELIQNYRQSIRLSHIQSKSSSIFQDNRLEDPRDFKRDWNPFSTRKYYNFSKENCKSFKFIFWIALLCLMCTYIDNNCH